MKKHYVRIVEPIEQRLSIDDNERDRLIVKTISKVLDPLGLSQESFLKTESTPATGGNCGWSPTLGITQTLMTYIYKPEAQERTGTCTINAANYDYAAAFQLYDEDPRVPPLSDCFDEGREFLDTPSCKYFKYQTVRYDKLLPSGFMSERFVSRFDRVSEGREVFEPLNENNAYPEFEDPVVSSPDRRVVGMPILKRIEPDGRRKAWVVVIYDFDQYLPTVMEATVDTSYVGIGLTSLWTAEAGKLLPAPQFPYDKVDQSLYERVMQKPWPNECPTDIYELEDDCEVSFEDFRKATSHLVSKGLDTRKIEEALSMLPTYKN